MVSGEDNMRFWIVLVGTIALATWAGRCEAEPSESAIRSAVEKSLPYVAERGEWWIEEKQCVSCHRVSFMTWTLAEASKAGFDVDAGKLAEWQAWSVESLLEKRDDEKGVGEANLDGISQILWSERHREGGEPASLSPASRQFIDWLVEHQQTDGTWKAGGQLPLQRRDARETHLVSTAWNTLALGTIPADATAATAATESRRKAMQVLTTDDSKKTSTEWHVVRLLLAVQQNDAAGVEQWAESLRKLQHADGGWGWIADAESDALGTGQALYALMQAAGVQPAVAARDSEPVQRGLQFLIETQLDDGSWRVPGTKAKAKGRPVETSNYWGSCWATLALITAIER